MMPRSSIIPLAAYWAATSQDVGQGDRFSALEPLKLGLRKIRGVIGEGFGQDVAMPHGWGTHYIARGFKTELMLFGLKSTPALGSV